MPFSKYQCPKKNLQFTEFIVFTCFIIKWQMESIETDINKENHNLKVKYILGMNLTKIIFNGIILLVNIKTMII